MPVGLLSPTAGHRLTVAVALAGLVLVCFGSSTAASAHNVTLLSAATASLYVSGNSYSWTQPYDQVGGPVNKDWTTTQRISLSGGDNLQTVSFDYQVHDSDVLDFWVGEFGVPVRDWGSGRTYGSTITSHIGGYFGLQLYIYNWDVNGQNFVWYARAGYQ